MDLKTTKCAAMSCTMAVSSDFLMCRRHWRMVPKETQEEIWEAHHAGDAAQLLTLVSHAAEIVRMREIEIGRRCRSRNAPIFYALSVTNQQPMPIDANPDPSGRVLVRRGKKSTQLYAKVVGTDANGEEERFTSHFATWPQANEWRKRAGEARAEAQKKTDARAN